MGVDLANIRTWTAELLFRTKEALDIDVWN